MNRKSLWKSRFKGVKARRSRTGPAAKKKHIHQTFAWTQSAITLRGVNTPSQVVQGLGLFFATGIWLLLSDGRVEWLIFGSLVEVYPWHLF